MITTASRLFSADLSGNSMQGSRLALTPSSMNRGRKTYNMFGRRNHTEAGSSLYTNPMASQYPNPYLTTSSYNYQSGQQYPTQSGFVNVFNNTGVYSMFSVGAYDLRDFGDLNQTHVGEALGTYRYLAERTNWRRCHETGSAGKTSSGGLSVFVMVLIGMFMH